MIQQALEPFQGFFFRRYQPMPPARPTTRLDTEPLDLLVAQALEAEVFPGLELLFAQGERLLLHKAYGRTTGEAKASPLPLGQSFDLASLTKPLATAAACLKLWEQGRLDLAAPVKEWLPEWNYPVSLSCLDLLTHRSGLPHWAPLYLEDSAPAAWKALVATPPKVEPRSRVIYSCLNFLLLAELVRRVTQESLSGFCDRQIFAPLGLKSFRFNPGPRTEVVPSAHGAWRNRRLWGEVQDENAARFDGEGGNAGLFGNGADLWTYALMLLQGGLFQGVRVFEEKTLALWTQNHNPPGLAPRALGWDYCDQSPGYWSCGERFGRGSIGHLGFTGTGLWIDRAKGSVAVHLSHRVWYGKDAKLEEMRTLRPQLHNLMTELAP